MEESVEARYQVIAEIIVNGASRQDAIALSVRRWQVSVRTAELYVQTVRKRLAGEAAEGDRLFYLHLSQLQRDRMVGLVLRYTARTDADYNPQVMQSLASMLTAVRGLLDSRDRTAAEIHGLVQEKVEGAAKLVSTEEADRTTGSNGRKSSGSANGHEAAPSRPTASGSRFDPRRKPKSRGDEAPTPLHREESACTEIPETSSHKANGHHELGGDDRADLASAAACASCAPG
jgi:hypothetical protein